MYRIRCSSSIPVFSTGYLSTYVYSFIFLLLLPFSYCSCPKNVNKESHNCFNDYNTHLLNIQQSHYTLFSGVDVHLLQSFCSSYNGAIRCIQELKEDCPGRATTKEEALIKLEGAQEELSDLCRDDKIYEVYAIHQTCFMMQGQYSESCYERNMNTSAQIMGRTNNEPLQKLCRNLRETIKCIKSNIYAKCSQAAADLVEKLVKPTVRSSSRCVGYTVVTTTQRARDTKKQGQLGNTNNSTDSASSIYLNSVLMCLALLLSMHSSKIS